MARLKVAAFGLSLDGFGAGRNQDITNPLGVRGPEIMGWFFPTKTFHTKVVGSAGEKGAIADVAVGETGVDDSMARQSFDNIGAWILGRNMFGPVRGPWPDETWRGWWGDEPPYHVPVFVLTHYPRAPIEMKGDTTFHFVTEGFEVALKQAMAVAQGKDVRVGGGAATIRQYLNAGLIDEMHLAVSPVLIGAGEKLLDGLDLPALGYVCEKAVAGERATHMFIVKR